MLKAFTRRAEAVVLAVSLVLAGITAPGQTEQTARAYAQEKGTGGHYAAKAATPPAVILTPFEGQWKYYGQTRSFVEDEHYALSEEIEPGAFGTWQLTLEKEEPGLQNFRLDSVPTSEEGQEVQIAENAPKYEIRKYTTAETAALDSLTENVSNGYLTATESVTILPPEDYFIRGEKESGTWDVNTDIEEGWSESLETGALQQGDNEITYYLRSNKADSTKKAIDLTAKKLVLKVDSIAPSFTELSFTDNTDVTAQVAIAGSESSTYYYMVVPSGYFEGAEPETTDIRKNVDAKIGIVGKGRLEGTQLETLSLEALNPETEYVVYAYLEDKAGNKSEVKESAVVKTDKMALAGDVTITGTPEVGKTLTAAPVLTSVDTGALTYQWYRIKLPGDAAALDEAYDTTEGTDVDAQDAEDEDDEDSEDEDEADDADAEADDAGDADGQDTDAGDGDDVSQIESLDGAELIKGAAGTTYQVTKQDIGYRLIASVTAENYSGNVSAETTFVPKLIPAYTVPAVSSRQYSPVKTLASISLPKQWSWVHASLVPVYGNSGYRAKFVPTDTKTYRSMIVAVKIPITKRTIKKSMMKIAKKKAYAGKAIKENFKIVDQKKRLQEKEDYKASYKNNKKRGKATVSIRGKGNYKGSFKVTYKIVKKSIKNLDVKYTKKKIYNGKKKTISLTLKNDTVKLKKNKDYKVQYKNNTKIGKAQVIIRGIGNYTGKKVLKFSIIPKKPVIKKIKGRKSSISMSVSRNRAVKGYYVDISKTGSFKKGDTSEYVIYGNDFSVRSLAAGTYYVRVKAFAKSKGKTYTSAYSRTKKITLK